MQESVSKNPEGASASFKLSTLESIGADPLMKPIDHELLGAYMKYMNWPGRTSYLTNLKARIMTNMSAQSTVTVSRARLVRFGYLTKLMTKFNGAVVYQINNPRAERIAEHIVIAEGTLRDQDAYRKEQDRIRKASRRVSVTVALGDNENRRDRSVHCSPGVMNAATQNRARGSENRPDRVMNCGDNSLEQFLEGGALKRETSQRTNLAPAANPAVNGYARASRGAV